MYYYCYYIVTYCLQETNVIREHAVKLLESAESSKLNHHQLEEEVKNLLGFLKEVAFHYSAICNPAIVPMQQQNMGLMNGGGWNNGNGMHWQDAMKCQNDAQNCQQQLQHIQVQQNMVNSYQQVT